MNCEACGNPISTGKYCNAICRNSFHNRDQLSGYRKRQRYGYAKREIVGLDGEGFHREGEPSRYVMLQATEQDTLLDVNGLDTETIFRWLVSLPRSTLKFGFAFSYDVNMILADVSRRCLHYLWRNNYTIWEGWFIRWIPGKQFIVQHRESGRSVCVWDVWPFVQQSFVGWLRDWELTDTETIAEISAMKDQRGNFAELAISDIEAYNRSEVDLLASGVGRMLELINGAGIKLTSYYGPGSIAGALMRAEGVREHIADPPEWAVDPIRSAYRGGRSEMATVGWEHEVSIADLNSAYPDAERRLPCLAHGSWHHRDGNSQRQWALNRVEWSIEPKTTTWGPFPVLPEQGTLRYPLHGSGWYWSHEVSAARRLYGRQIKVRESIEFRPGCDERPFAFIEARYEERRKLKEAGDLREKIVKLGINSVYGKMAQQVGDNPPFQSFAWAGMTTAWTRARILDVIAENPDNVALISTDGIVVHDTRSFTIGDGLGEWSVKPIDRILIVQPGVYWADYGDETLIRSRGFGRADIPFESVADYYPTDKPPTMRTLLAGQRIVTNVTRFIGLGYVAITRRWDEWRTWQTKSRKLSTNPWPRRIPYAARPGRILTAAPSEARADRTAPTRSQLRALIRQVTSGQYDGTEAVVQ